MFTVPPFVAGTVLRLRRETAEPSWLLRAQELEDERELFAEIALRHERARIASELHDIVGHAISVMVIQAAAGQRLVDADPARAKEAFAAISESARQGRKDLERLIELLGGRRRPGGGPTCRWSTRWSTRAGRSGLNVTCRFEGDRDGVPEPVAHLAFRVVQESLTNALRYAPGAEVRIVISVDEGGRGLAVRVENDRAAPHDPAHRGHRARPDRSARTNPDAGGPDERGEDPSRWLDGRGAPPERLTCGTGRILIRRHMSLVT